MVRYSDELIDEIRNNNDIVDVISQYMILKRSGRNFFGLCPFHKEKSPSFSVSPDKQIFHCFGCGVGGNVIHFVSKIESLNFKETLEFLAERVGMALPTAQGDELDKKDILRRKVYEINEKAAIFYHENLYKANAKPAQEYVKKRKLDNNTLKSFYIGYSGTFNELYIHLKQKGFSDEEILASSLVNKTENGKFIDRFRNRLMFPIQDTKNKFIAFGGRVLDDSKPKYINSPENIAYSKGRNLYGLNIAKNSCKEKVLVVEGYMDAISLHQRGINNAVASLGTALTEAQGRLLRKHADQVIISYDSDGAGQTATMRGLEILKNMGCDVRILQMDGAKDPDEYVIKFGTGRFQKLVDEAISLVEFKVKILKNTLNIETTNDKIKFLNEIAKILSNVDNEIEKEIYIDKISKDYQITKEAIYAEINKINYAQNRGSKVLDKKFVKPISKKTEQLTDAIIKRENMIISLLISDPSNIYLKISKYINVEDFKQEINKKIIKKLYEALEKGDININNILGIFEEQEEINHITEIMADDYEITDTNKTIENVIHIYEKEKLIEKKNEIIDRLKSADINEEEAKRLDNELSEIVIKLARIK